MSAKPFVVILLSGGLDSVLAAKMMLEQNVEVEAVGFRTPFFDAEKGKWAAQKLGVPFHEIDFARAHFEKVKNPRYGHGKGINPCIDCHALMLETAGLFLKNRGKFEKGFVVTGEVVGQRPMSQNKNAFRSVAKLLPEELRERVVRPLSAQLLDETLPEREEWVDRARFLGIEGRGRERQLELAAEWGIDFFAPPAGGCVLTEKNFGGLVRELLVKWPTADHETAGLLRYGRVTFFDGTVCVVARRAEENQILQKLVRKNDVQIKLQKMPGPVAVVRPFGDGADLREAVLFAKKQVAKYSRAAREVEFGEVEFEENRI